MLAVGLDLWTKARAAGALPAVGGGALLTGEANGFATDFLHPVDAERVAVKTSGTVVSSGLSFFTNAGVSSKWVYNAAGVLVNVPVGQLALDYDPVTHAARGLLCEPAATNLLLQSQTFDNASWTKGAATVTANAVAAPDGTLTADALVPTTGTPFLQQVLITAAGTTYTCSVFIENGTLGIPWFEIALVSTSTWRCWFNLSTGVKGSATGSPVSWNMVNVGSGWFRIDVTVVAGTTSMTCYLLTATADGDSSTSVAGDSVKPSFYAWGVQIEAGTVATSYIPTLGATVTRAQDNISAIASSIGLSATAGSWWAENQTLEVATQRYVLGNSVSATSHIYHPSGGGYGLYDGTTLIKAGAITAGVVYKAMSAFQVGDRAVTFNGLAPTTDAGATTNLLSTGANIVFGSNVSSPELGYIRKVRYLPRRPSNAELQTMTT